MVKESVTIEEMVRIGHAQSPAKILRLQSALEPVVSNARWLPLLSTTREVEELSALSIPSFNLYAEAGTGTW